MKILAIGDPHGKVPGNLPRKNIDFILLTGDIGKADLARKIYLTDRLKGIIPSKKDKDSAYKETYDSTMRLLKRISNGKRVYSIMGNVSRNSSEVIRDAKKIKNIYVIKNSLRRIEGLRLGFLEYFVDNCWIKEFKEKDKKRIQRAKKETAKAEKVLDKFAHPDEKYMHNDVRDANNITGKRDTHLCTPDSCGVIPECKNGHAHAQGMIIQSSISMIISEGKLAKGRWQEIMLVELDHDRKRKVTVLVQGTKD